MTKHGKDLLVENLSAAALLGLLGLLVAAASLVLDGVADRRERAELGTFTQAPLQGQALRVADPAFSRIYEVRRHGKRLYGAVVTIGDHHGLLRAAAFLGPDGRLDGVETLEVVPADAPFTRDGWFGDFLGKGGDSPFPQEVFEGRHPEVTSGASESYHLTGSVLGRLSGKVIAAGRKD